MYRRLIIVGLLLCGLLLMVFAYKAGSRPGPVDPHIRIKERKAGEPAALASDRYPQPPWTGEVSRTAQRLKEAEALGVATALVAVGERLRGRTLPTVDALLRSVVREDLLPPGLERRADSGPGEVQSAGGRLAVRYRPSPVGVEIISIPFAGDPGPILIVRVPGEGRNPSALFESIRPDQTSIPPAFAPEAEVISAGFTRKER